jgi:hypothetical protein
MPLNANPFRRQLNKYEHRLFLPLELKQLFRDGKVTPEDVRRFLKNFKESEGIPSNDWQALSEVLDTVPSLQLVGDIGAGKSYLVKQLVHHDKKRVYIVLDAHNEYPELPSVNNIVPEQTVSARIELPKMPEGAMGMFTVYKGLVTNRVFPPNFVLVVEEALRYENVGLKNLLAESRKFIKVVAVMQEKPYDFCPSVKVKPHKPFL